MLDLLNISLLRLVSKIGFSVYKSPQTIGLRGLTGFFINDQIVVGEVSVREGHVFRCHIENDVLRVSEV